MPPAVTLAVGKGLRQSAKTSFPVVATGGRTRWRSGQCDRRPVPVHVVVVVVNGDDEPHLGATRACSVSRARSRWASRMRWPTQQHVLLNSMTRAGFAYTYDGAGPRCVRAGGRYGGTWRVRDMFAAFMFARHRGVRRREEHGATRSSGWRWPRCAAVKALDVVCNATRDHNGVD